jgi:hypothetical protein
MVYSLSNQLYKYEHGLTAAEQRAEHARTGEAAAALRDLRRCLGRAFWPRRRVRPARVPADAMTTPARVMSSVR